MSIRKSLIAVAAMALALMGFASSAMAATDGVVRDVTTNGIIPENRELHFVGAAKFTAANGSTYQCHVTSISKAIGTTGTTGNVTNFGIPDTTKCVGTGGLAGCELSGHATKNLPYHLTATPTDFDVTGTIVIENSYKNCLVKTATLTFSSITLKPLKTGVEANTGTEGKLGGTAASGEPIAGAELEGTGIVHTVDIFGVKREEAVTASGKLELTSPDRCTWKLVSS